MGRKKGKKEDFGKDCSRGEAFGSWEEESFLVVERGAFHFAQGERRGERDI